MLYLKEKLVNGLHSLVGPIPSQRERLKEAFHVGHTAVLDKRHWPSEDDEIQKKLAHLYAAVHTVEHAEKGSIGASIDAMTDEQVDRCVDNWVYCCLLVEKTA